MTVIDDLVLLRSGFFLAAAQFEHVQSHSGTPPIDAVPRTVISIQFSAVSWGLNALDR